VGRICLESPGSSHPGTNGHTDPDPFSHATPADVDANRDANADSDAYSDACRAFDGL
jgi:hypothetical protein